MNFKCYHLIHRFLTLNMNFLDILDFSYLSYYISIKTLSGSGKAGQPLVKE